MILVYHLKIYFKSNTGNLQYFYRDSNQFKSIQIIIKSILTDHTVILASMRHPCDMVKCACEPEYSGECPRIKICKRIQNQHTFLRPLHMIITKNDQIPLKYGLMAKLIIYRYKRVLNVLSDFMRHVGRQTKTDKTRKCFGRMNAAHKNLSIVISDTGLLRVNTIGPPWDYT